MRRTSYPLLLGGLVVVAMIGCGPRPPEPADPGAARAALTQALDAWQQGQTPTDLQASSPPIHVADVDWQGGWKLHKYKLDAKDVMHGAAVRLGARLSLRSPKGKTAEKQVFYLVGTQPTLTVVRADEGD